VVVWNKADYGPGGGYGSYNSEVVFRHFRSDGGPFGFEMPVNTYTDGYQISPAIASNAAGDFMVVWNSEGSTGTDSDQFSIQGRRFETPIFADGFEDGTALGWLPHGHPWADFDFITNGLFATFVNRSVGDPPLSCLWDFGDGSLGSTLCDPPTHFFLVSNTYYVRLEVFNSVGFHSVEKAVTVAQ
ncbi:MAG: PKD domain-containing protein, partial [Acidobacteriota bacterium]